MNDCWKDEEAIFLRGENPAVYGKEDANRYRN